MCHLCGGYEVFFFGTDVARTPCTSYNFFVVLLMFRQDMVTGKKSVRSFAMDTNHKTMFFFSPYQKQEHRHWLASSNRRGQRTQGDLCRCISIEVFEIRITFSMLNKQT